MGYGDSQKLENSIGVEHGKLDLQRFAFPGFEDLTNNGTFRVVGCINHKGNTSSGHYTSNVCGYYPDGKVWWADFDDEKV